MNMRLAAIGVITLTLGLFAKDPGAADVLTPYVTPDMITLQPEADYAHYELVVTGPHGFVHRQTFDGRHVPFFEIFNLGGDLIADGLYNFELRAAPHLSDAVKTAMLEARATGDESTIQDLQAAGDMGVGFVYASTFRVHKGAIVLRDQPELIYEANSGRDEGAFPGNPIITPEITNTDSGVDSDDPGRPQTFTTDLIVQGSACVGLDCTNTESFGFDTLRFKENNLRIMFDDSSSTGSFPKNDWRLIANDSVNGGSEYFAIEDATNNKTPFKVQANAPNHSFFVKDSGQIGIGTSTPVMNLHVREGNSPTLRLEQDGSKGFQNQVWDISSNETNFFIRDVTNSSKLPFRIRPGAPDSSIDIKFNGNVGIGYEDPTYPLHVRRIDGTAKLMVEDTFGNAGIRIEAADNSSLYLKSKNTDQANRNMLTLENNGGPIMALHNTAANGGNGNIWNIISQGNNSLTFNATANGGTEVIFAGDGEITAAGVVLTSDVNMKENFEEVSAQDILQGVIGLDITKWNFINSQDDVRHLGPMAQDFHAAFGLGDSDTGINSTDANGVAFASIQALHELVVEKDARIKTLEKQVSKMSALEQRLAAMSALEQRLAALEAKLAED